MSQVGSPQIQAIPFTVTVPGGTQINAPQTTALPLADMWVESIEVEVPPGPGGSMGFNLVYAGTQMIPFSQQTSWLIVDNYQHSFPVSSQMGKGLQVVAYNIGFWNHSIYLRVLGTPISAYLAGAAQAPPAPIDFGS